MHVRCMFSTDVWFCSAAEAAVKGHDMSENAKCDAKHAEIEGKKTHRITHSDEQRCITYGTYHRGKWT